MPKRDDINSILIIGAGPIVIGQACEFDYSGMQACKALREEGYRVILVNSNPATIMTDPDSADATYIEPITADTVARIIEREKPDALLPTMGGQTALNCSLELGAKGVLKRCGTEMIGANEQAIALAEDRQLFREAMDEIGLESARSVVVGNWEDARRAAAEIKYPIIIRPSFTLGGSGGGIACDAAEFETIVKHGLEISPVGEVLLEESLLGWKEFEMEVVRDKNDNCLIVCAIENLDPMGVHTGDSITVAPAQTLTDKEYQRLRDASIAVLRRVGVETGGSNVQFAVNPQDGRVVIIEMNPRVSRSSALASKATGFPIAKIAAKLAVGYTLDELRNEITGGAMPSSFEPTIDYVVVKIPRFAFEKFPHSKDRLDTQMRSVGEAMAIGRTFKESLQKALCSLETGYSGLDPASANQTAGELRKALRAGVDSGRLWRVADAFRSGATVEELCADTKIDPWFLSQIDEIIKTEAEIMGRSLRSLDAAAMRALKRDGFSDRRLSLLLNCSEEAVYQHRRRLGAHPVYKRVDTCAAEFASATAYLYSTYEDECESDPSSKRKVVILGSGPNRIGQGIEFDYCCVHTALALREEGFETIMVNCNPETVSTDYDTSDRLYFEPLSFEHVMEIIALEKPCGALVQYGGQTPLNLARKLAAAGVPILGTGPESIDLAEDRERFQRLIRELKLKQPPCGIARSADEAIALAEELGFPVIARPSYVLGGRGMEIIYNLSDLRDYIAQALAVSDEFPLLIDRFISDAIEADVDAVCDGKEVLIGGVMQHIEQAGIHSGDSACSLPPYSLPEDITRRIREQMTRLALALDVRGAMNAQFAIKDEEIYVIEANPRASRTVPFVSKATGLQLAKIAARCIVGRSLAQQGIDTATASEMTHSAVKEAVFPFVKFSDADPMLGPEMRSTGEVMGVGRSFGEAYAKSQIAAGNELPHAGKVLISVRDADKDAALEAANRFVAAGFAIVATAGTAAHLRAAGMPCETAHKINADRRPNIKDLIDADEIRLIVNTTTGKRAVSDSLAIRRAAVRHKVCYATTIAGALAIAEALRVSEHGVYRLQDLQKGDIC